MSANGGTDASGGTNRSRNFDFNTFASELFNNITVRKTASAEIEEGSLGATVDLRAGASVRLRRTHDRRLACRSAYNDLSEDVDPRATFLVSNTFADGKFGALLSVGYTERNLIDEGSSTVRWMPDLGMPASAGSTPLSAPTRRHAGPDQQRVPSAHSALRPVLTHEQERLGVTAALQFAPSDANLVQPRCPVLGVRCQARRESSSRRRLQHRRRRAANRIDAESVTAEIDGTDTLVYGVFNDVDIRSEVASRRAEHEFTQVTLEGNASASATPGQHRRAGRLSPNRTTTTRCRPRCCSMRSNSRRLLVRLPRQQPPAASTTTSTSRIRPTGSSARPRRLIADPPASAEHDQQLPDRQLDFEVDASDTFTLKFGPHWKNFIFKSSGTAPLERNDGEHRVHVRRARRSPA